MGRHYHFLILFILIIEISGIVFESPTQMITTQYDSSSNRSRDNQFANSPSLAKAQAQESDVHPQSIDGFEETSQDDTLQYPDQFHSSEPYYSTNGSATQSAVNNHTSTHNLDGVNFASSGDGEVSPLAITIDFRCAQQYLIDGFKIDLFGGVNVSSECSLFLFNFEEAYWYNYDATSAGLSWSNKTVFQHSLWDNDTICFRIVGPPEKALLLSVDFIQIQIFFVTINNGSYAESFSDSSDWNPIENLNNFGTSFTTAEDDFLDFEFAMLKADDIEGIYTQSPSLEGIDYYFEFRFYLTNNLFMDWVEVTFYDDDYILSSASSSYICDTLPVSWNTIKFHISSIASGDISNIEAISIELKGDLGAHANLRCDYIRISPGEDMGWQYDGSTTTGIIQESHDGWSYYTSSDGDMLNITMQRNGGTAIFGCVWLLFDITSVASNLEIDYYQFAEMVFEIPQNPELYWIFIPYIDGKTTGDESQAIGQFFWGEQPETTARANLAALNRSIWSQSGIRVIWYCSSSNGVSTCLIDYVKIYSILNFTVTQTRSKASDVLYVDHSNLACETDTTIFEIHLDPILAVDTVVYNILEISRSNFSVDTSYALYYWSPWNSLTSYFMDEGILRSIRLRLNESGLIMSVKFRPISSEELLNLPRITFVAVLPSNPTTNGEVSINCGVEGTSIQQVTIAALTFPNEYVNKTYALSETQPHVWSIVFVSVQEGYYVFMVSVVSRYGKTSGYIPLTVVDYPPDNQNPGLLEWQLALASWLNIGFIVIFIAGFYWLEKRLRELKQELASLKGAPIESES